jgi:hypothetical protein
VTVGTLRLVDGRLIDLVSALLFLRKCVRRVLSEDLILSPVEERKTENKKVGYSREIKCSP